MTTNDTLERARKRHNPTTQRQLMELLPAHWTALQELAMATNSLATRGSTKGQPSWRAMIRRIAVGELTLASTKALAQSAPSGSASPSPTATAQPASSQDDISTEAIKEQHYEDIDY